MSRYTHIVVVSDVRYQISDIRLRAVSKKENILSINKGTVRYFTLRSDLYSRKICGLLKKSWFPAFNLISCQDISNNKIIFLGGGDAGLLDISEQFREYQESRLLCDDDNDDDG